MRRFVGIDLGQESAPDETMICKFRHWVEHYPPGRGGTVNCGLFKPGVSEENMYGLNQKISGFWRSVKS